MITEEDKINICKTLDYCWFFRLNNQIMCQDIFQTLNRVWNRVASAQETQTDRNRDSTKFRILIKTILDTEQLSKFINNPELTKISNIQPLIYNDGYVTELLGVPFSENIESNLSQEQKGTATTEHREFNKYLDKVRQNPNSKNRSEFINKFSRLLYMVRSNIAHGSKLQYQGSHRNEQICSDVYHVLLLLCNLILDNALFRVAAYGELRRDYLLHEPLVKNNEGQFITKAQVVGGVIQSENTLLFNHASEFERTKVEIFEFANANNIHNVDVVECMPRRLLPYYDGDQVIGFAWMYERFSDIENPKGPIDALSRNVALQERCKTLLYSLNSIKNLYANKKQVSGDTKVKFFGKLTLISGEVIHYENNKNASKLIHPFAPNLISLIDEIDTAYKSIFTSDNTHYPFWKQIDGAIFEDKEVHPKTYDCFPASAEEEISQKVYSALVKYIVSFVAGWVCDMCNVDDQIYEEMSSKSVN